MLERDSTQHDLGAHLSMQFATCTGQAHAFSCAMTHKAAFWNAAAEQASCTRTILWMVRYAVCDMSPAASSSKITAASARLSALPPTSSLQYTPPKPSAAAALRVRMLNSAASSHLAACGASSFAAKPAASR